MEQGSERGRLVAIALVAILLASFGYSLGYQNGNTAGLRRLDWQLNRLAARCHNATVEREESGVVDSAQAGKPGRSSACSPARRSTPSSRSSWCATWSGR